MAAKPELVLSRAVLAKVEHANTIEGCVLWWTAGSAIANEINESDTRLESLGFEEAAPRGLSIWEGDYVYEPADQCTLPVGTFRAPTAMEALAICAGRNPFEAAPLATFIEPIAAWALRQEAETSAELTARIQQLEQRRDELLQLVAKISQETPLPEEVAEALKHRGVLLAEVGTLRARIAELTEARFQDSAVIQERNTLISEVSVLHTRVAELEAIALRYASEEPPTQPFERPEPPDVNEEIVIDDPTAPTPNEESR